MKSPTRLLRHVPMLVAFATIVLFSGCAKVGPVALKGLTQVERKAVQEQGKVVRVASQVGKAGKWVAEEFGTDIVVGQVEQWQKKEKTPVPSTFNVSQSAGRFPHPASSVRPLPGYTPHSDPVTGQYTLPNNYGGVILYAADGTPLGFSAFNQNTRKLDCFDRFGNAI